MERCAYLVHHGIKGMRWGVRRYQNPDGSLTPEGRAHYQKIASEPHGSAEKAYGLLNIAGHIKYRKQKKAVAKYRDAVRKLNDDNKIDLGKDGDVIRKFANTEGISITDAKRFYDAAMKDYNKVKDSDVVKKYPHDYENFGHPMQAGGYASQKLSDDIERKSGSWYFEEAVKGSNFESALKSYQKTRDSFYKANRAWDGGTAEKQKAKQKLLDAVLKDLGMPITQANRDAIESTVFWD